MAPSYRKSLAGTLLKGYHLLLSFLRGLEQVLYRKIEFITSSMMSFPENVAIFLWNAIES